MVCDKVVMLSDESCCIAHHVALIAFDFSELKCRGQEAGIARASSEASLYKACLISSHSESKSNDTMTVHHICATTMSFHIGPTRCVPTAAELADIHLYANTGYDLLASLSTLGQQLCDINSQKGWRPNKLKQKI